MTSDNFDFHTIHLPIDDEVMIAISEFNNQVELSVVTTSNQTFVTKKIFGNETDNIFPIFDLQDLIGALSDLQSYLKEERGKND